MKKIYCVYCGVENDFKNERCCKCKKELNPEEHLFKDYIFKHIKDDLKSKVEDNLFSLFTNYIKSHLYGVIMSVAVISTITVGIVNLNNNVSFKEVVTSKPDVENPVVELDINSELVTKLHGYVNLNNNRYVETGFYADKLVKYDDLEEDDKVKLIFKSRDFDMEGEKISSCEGLRGYKAYDLCVGIPDLYDVESRGYTKYNTASFLEKYRSVFGLDKDVARKDYHLIATQCEFNDNDEMMCYGLMEGFMSGMYEYSEIEKAVKTGNNIIIYDRYLVATCFISINGEFCGTYKDAALTKKISDDETAINYADGQLYKHIYKLDRDGNYYWYSSEPIDRI